MKIAYTVITDHEKYSLKDVRNITPGWEYICFSTEQIYAPNWTIIHIPQSPSPKKLSRRVKILVQEYLPSATVSVYLDSKFTIRTNLDDFVQKYLADNELAVMSHNKRTCIYDEESVLLKLGLDDPSVIKQQVDRYRLSGFPTKAGLYAPGIMIRRQTDALRKLMTCWFSEVEHHSYRDILSLPVCLARNPVKLSVMPWNDVYPMFAGKHK